MSYFPSQSQAKRDLAWFYLLSSRLMLLSSRWHLASLSRKNQRSSTTTRLCHATFDRLSPYSVNFLPRQPSSKLAVRKKMVFFSATKLGTTNNFFVAATKNFAAATKRFVDRTKHFAVVTKHFCYPYFNKWFCWYNKTFYNVCNQFFRQPLLRRLHCLWTSMTYSNPT